MAQSRDIGKRAYAARIAQKLADPAQAILGYQQMIVEEVRENGPAGALPDLEKVLRAALELNALIERLMARDFEHIEGGDAVEAVLRHDLRTPMNAILGYSEMVVEDFADDLPERLKADIARTIQESRILLAQIEFDTGHFIRRRVRRRRQ